MISAAEYQRRLKMVATPSVLQNLANSVMIDNSIDILELKRQDFLKGDIYGDGTLRSYKSEDYAIMKENMNPLAGGAVDLIMTGAFEDAMYIKRITSNRYFFGNNDIKARALSAQYGKAIFGLNQNVFNQYQANVLAPKYIQLIKDVARIG